MITPKEKGEIYSELSRVASLTPTLSLGFISFTSFRISMVPLKILVVMLKAWKKGLLRPKNSVLGWHNDLIQDGDMITDSSLHVIGQQHAPNLSEVLLGKLYTAHVSPDRRQHFLQS